MSEAIKQNPVMPDFANMTPEATQIMWMGSQHTEALAQNELIDIKNEIAGIKQSILNINQAEKKKSWSKTTRLAAVAAIAVGAFFAGNALNDDNSSEKIATATTTEQTSTTPTRVLDQPTAPKGLQIAPKVSASELMMGKVAKDKTTNEAVTDYQSGSIRGAFKKIFGDKGSFDHLKASHDQNKVSELAGRYANNVKSENVAEGIAISIINDKGVSQSYYNNMNGRRAGTTASLGHDKRVAELAKELTDNDTKFAVKTVNGSYFNSHINSATGEVGDQAMNFTNLKVMEITLDNGKTILVKIGGGSDAEGEVCLNPLLKFTPTPKKVVKIHPKPHVNPMPKPPVVTPPPKPQPPVTHPTPPTPPVTPPEMPKPPVVTPPEMPKPPVEPPKEDCKPGYIKHDDRCVHKPADGPPPVDSQPPHHVKPTPGYKPGNAEAVDGTQHGDPTNLNPTPYGTEVPDSQQGGKAPGGGDSSVVSHPGVAAPANPNFKPGTASGGTTAGTSTPSTAPEAQTPSTGQTAPAGSDPGMPN